MEDKWFKQKQREAGVTADVIAEALGRDRSLVSRIYVGRQVMTFEQAKVFSEILKVPLNDVLVRAGIADAGTASELKPGFSESDAAQWIPKEGSNEDRSLDIARAHGGDSPGIDVWQVKSRALALAGYLEGDFMLIDTHQRDTCKTGDTVIAQVYDWNAGAATTILRRFEPPVLVAASADPGEWRTHVVDHNNVVIMGKVIASWR